MTELKTLKDLKKNGIETVSEKLKLKKIFEYVDVEELKQEAIKWVKKFEQEEEWSAGKINMIWIKHFFNLTEADIQLNEKSEEK